MAVVPDRLRRTKDARISRSIGGCHLTEAREVAASSASLLVIFGGLPGSGKSTLAKALAAAMPATYVRIDTLEQALRDLCDVQVEGEGYELGYRLAADNLRLGGNVVADSCNPIELTRRAWERVARDAGVSFVNVEVVCSDAEAHRRRVETRVAEVPGLELPSWADVVARDYERWRRPRWVVDTAGRSPEQSLDELLDRLESRKKEEIHDQR